MLKTKKRFRKCRYCKESTVPYGAMQPFCFKNECITEHNRVTKEKANRRDLKDFKSKNKAWVTKQAQKAVNAYVRLRDKYENCISCQAPAGFRIEAGHYRSSGNNHAIRFHTLNIWAQDHKCNCHMSANLIPYRENLIKKIGLEKVEWLESQTQPRSYTLEYLHRLIRVFKKKTKLYESRVLRE